MPYAMSMEDFLREVLPESGVYYAAQLRQDGAWWNSPCQDIDTLAAKLRAYTAEGVDAYYPPAAYKEPQYWDEGKQKYRKRTKANVRAVRAFWADVEVGKYGRDGQLADSSYADLESAVEGLIAFCRASRVPGPTLLICSGHGLHAYWVLDTEIDPDTWQHTAHALKALEIHHGLRADQALTANSAAVLRPVESFNYKHDPLPVYALIPPRKRLNAETFCTQIIALAEALGVTRPRTNASSDDLSEGLQSLISGTERNWQPQDAELIANRCQTLGDMRLTRGNHQSYPLWIACLSILTRTSQGDAIAHQWSAGHDKYQDAACQGKIDEVKTHLKCYTCATIKGLDGNSCGGCEQTVNSPISLGLPDKVHQTYIPATEDTPEEFIPAIPTSLEWCFKWSQQKGLERLVDKDADTWEKVSDQFPVLRYIWRDRNSNEFHVRCESRVRPHDWTVSDLRLSSIGQGGLAFRREVSGQAGIIGKFDHLEWYMKTWVEHLRRTSDTLLVRHNLGWQVDNSFLLGHTLYTPDGPTTDAAIARDLYQYAHAHDPMPKADLQKYIEGIDYLYNRVRHQPYQFAWLAGFGSALLPLLWQGPLGVPICLWSEDPGRGKSTAAMLALSIWGNVHANGQIINADGATETALYTVFGQRHHLPVLLDETTTWSGEQLGQFSYRYASGQPKAQAKAEGGLRDNTNRRWTNFAFLTANKSAISQVISSIRNAGARVVRIFEIEIPTFELKTEDKQLIDSLLEHGGAAGHLFAEQIVYHREDIIKLLRAHEQRYYKQCKLGTEARFWVAAAASVYVAGLLTQQLGLHSFSMDLLDKWIGHKLTDLNAVAQSAADDPEDLYHELLAHIAPGLIVTEEEGNTERPVSYSPGFYSPRGEITGRVIVGQNILWVPHHVVKNWCKTEGVDLEKFAGSLLTKSLLLDRCDRFYLTKGTRIPGGRPLCWRFNANAVIKLKKGEVPESNVVPMRKAANSG